MKLLSIFKRQRQPDPSLQRARVQYDSISRTRVARGLFDAEAPEVTSDAISHQAMIGLIIVTVAAYVVGLAIGGAKPASVVIDSPIEMRNQNIAEALIAHPTDSLVGEFWRILPSNHQGGDRAALVPLATCTNPVMPYDNTYQQHSFAYLLDADSTPSGFAHCTIDQLINVYGRPSAITITAGTVEHPREELLFYDHGGRKPQEKTRPVLPTGDQSSSAVHPTTIGSLTNTSCEGHKTIMQVVAHEDDDLLFMNPDLLHAIQKGDCVRTIYLTAGDAGSSKFYWLGRERGSEAAYALLGGFADEWTTQTVKLGNNRFVTVTSPPANNRFSLLFMHLPDGKPDGQGFQNSGFESIAKLLSGEKPTIQSVDTQSIYSRGDLLAGLRTLMEAYQPSEVRTQRPYNNSAQFSDHSDHISAGQLTTAAFKEYRKKHAITTLSYYIGYPIREQPVNVEGDDLSLKEQAFFTYANYDGAVCGTVDLCMARGDYGEYLQRQYRTDQ